MYHTTNSREYTGTWPSISWKPEQDNSCCDNLKILLVMPCTWGALIVHCAHCYFQWCKMDWYKKKGIEFEFEDRIVPMAILTVAFILVFMLILFVRWRMQGTRYAISVTAMGRHFFASIGSALAFKFGLNINMYTPYKRQNWFLAFYGLPFLLSVYFACLSGTVFERILRFFCIHPSTTNETQPLQLGRINQIIWGIRLISLAFCLGISGGILQIKIDSPNLDKSPPYTELFSRAVDAFICAGLSEEMFKMLWVGSLTMIPKYMDKPQMVVWTAFFAGVGFGYSEAGSYFVTLYANIMLAKNKILQFDPALVLFGNYATRFGVMFIHAFFTFPVAIAVSRQRRDCCWGLEMLTAFMLSIFLHGIHDYLIFIGDDTLQYVTSVVVIFEIVTVLYLIFCINLQALEARLDHWFRLYIH